MRYNTSFFKWMATGCLVLWGCKKTELVNSPLATLNLINATINLSGLKANFTQTGNKTGSYEYYSQISTSVAYGGYSLNEVLATKSIPLTIVSTADTTTSVFQDQLNLSDQGIYSLFLAGIYGAVDTLFIKEEIPVYSDSSCGVRFINLSYNSSPIVISLATTPTIAEFNELSYKQYSSFKTYPATVATSTYAFQVRSAANNTLLGSYTLSTPYFHNVTLAWIGQTGGSGINAPKVIRVNYY